MSVGCPWLVERWRVSEAGARHVHEVHGRSKGRIERLLIGPESQATRVDWIDRSTGEFSTVFESLPDDQIVFIDTAGRVERVCRPGIEDAATLEAPVARAKLLVAFVAFNPASRELNRQIQSIRSQTIDDWQCIVLDASSQPGSDELLAAAIEGDRRFDVVRVNNNLGAPENFFRLLGALPRDGIIALSDQDDRWRPDKLARTLAALEYQDATLAYCDMTVTNQDGEVVSNTFWKGRRNNWRDLLSLLLANTVTGAASVFRGSLLELAWPLPRTVGKTYHDQWLALCARVLGPIAYVDAPLYEYVQHSSQDIGFRPPRLPPLARDLISLARMGMWKLAPEIGAQTPIARAAMLETLRIKHLALVLYRRAEVLGRASAVSELAVMFGMPGHPESRRTLWRRAWERFGRESETVGAELRLLAAAEALR